LDLPQSTALKPYFMHRFLSNSGSDNTFKQRGHNFYAASSVELESAISNGKYCDYIGAQAASVLANRSL